MLNPDRTEFESEPSSTSENLKKSGHIPRWLRVPAFAIRTSLAVLTATPGMVVAADAITHRENSAIVYNSGQDLTANHQYDFDQLSPTPTVQSPEVHKLYLNSYTYVIRGFRDEANFRGDFPIDKSRTVYTGLASGYEFPVDESRIIANWGNTGIQLKAGQTLEISATGRMLLNDYREYYRALYAKSCNGSTVFDPGGNRYWNDKVCSPAGENPTMFRGTIGTGYRMEPSIPIGSHWKGSVNRSGMLSLWIYTGSLYGTSGGFDITVTVYPLVSTPTSVPSSRPAFTPEPIRTTIPTEKGSDLPGWLLGLGGVLLAGLGASEFYRRWKLRKHIGATVGTGGSATVPPPFRLKGLAGALGGPSNPNTAPSTGPSQPRPPDPEWVTGQQEFEKRWQAAKSKLSPVRPGDTGNEYEYILERFKAVMNMAHEMSLDNSAIQVPRMAMRIRAGIEYVIPEVWPDNSTLKRFFDPRFNAGYFTSEDFAKMVYLPEMYRNLVKFNKTQRNDVRRIHRILIHALHPDTSKNEADPKVQDSVDDLLKRFNPAWPYIENLIKLTP